MTGPNDDAGEGRSDPAAEQLQRVAEGDRSAFEQLYATISPTLFGICSRLMGEPAEAEEALQDAFLAIWRKAATFDPARGDAQAWLATLTRHCAIDRLRRRGRFAFASLDLADAVPDEAPPASDLIEREQTRARLEDCFDLLAPTDVTLIRTAFFQGSSYSELAARADRPLGTIKSRIRRALMKLAECLQ